MKTVASLLSALLLALPAPGEDLSKLIDALPLDPASESPYDFRGDPTWDFAPYKALHEAKRFGELYARLKTLVTKVDEDPAVLRKEGARNAYHTARQALVRLHYTYGNMEAGDTLMAAYTPGVNEQGETDPKLLRAETELERIRLVAIEMLEVFALSRREAFPEGAPRSYQALYAPLQKQLRFMSGE